jgi:hypothetical protein
MIFSEEIFNQIDQLRYFCERLKISLENNSAERFNMTPRLIIKDVMNIRNTNEV